MPQTAKLLSLAALLFESSAVRRARSSKRDTKVDAVVIADEPTFIQSSTTVALGEPGQVDFVFDFGSPGPGSPGLQNQRGSDPCFHGVRVFHSSAGMWGEYVDAVAHVTSLVSYWHSYMKVIKINVTDYSKVNMPCDEAATWAPYGYKLPSADLHSSEAYTESVDKVFQNPYYTNVSAFVTNISYIQDFDHAYEFVQQRGWGLVGSAFHPGDTVYVGSQVSHLIQHPSTKECVLTFQGTEDTQDWITNGDFGNEHFCGLVDEDETCSGVGTCEPRHPRGSFVHGGFKARLLAVTQTDDFQNNIIPYLPFCSKVAAAGHSLGGALAELFTACASKAPQPGQYGYDDYRFMAWNKGSSKRLRYIGEP